MSQQPCLPVSRKRQRAESSNSGISFFDLDKIDATEYLARVVEQARQLPEVFEHEDQRGTRKVAAREATSLSSSIEGSAACLAHLLSPRAALIPPPSVNHLPRSIDSVSEGTSEAWIKTTLSSFSRLRSYIQECKDRGIGKERRHSFPKLTDATGWHVFCVGKQEAQGNVDSYYDDGEEVEGNANHVEDSEEWELNLPEGGFEPTVERICQMDSILTRRLLSHLTSFFQQGWSMSHQRSLWLYALLANLEDALSLHRNDAALLFALCKELTKIRAHLVVHEGERPLLGQLNTLIVIVGVYFKQGGRVKLMEFEKIE